MIWEFSCGKATRSHVFFAVSLFEWRVLTTQLRILRHEREIQAATLMIGCAVCYRSIAAYPPM